MIDPADPDTTSAGSFFTNPILCVAAFAELEARAAASIRDGARGRATPSRMAVSRPQPRG